MKLLGRSNDHGYIMEINQEEHNALLSLMHAIEGGGIHSPRWMGTEPVWKDIDLSTALEAIRSFATTLAVANTLHGLTADLINELTQEKKPDAS